MILAHNFMNIRYLDAESVKRLQLEILDDIAQYCEKNNLRYYLAYGTLIGAIRHKGFIPWDDDIDIMMPRPDYEQFCREYKSQNGNLEVRSTQNDKSCYINFAKVHDIRTRYQEEYSIENDYGVFVDVFPLDGFGTYRQMKKCYRLFKLIHYKSLSPNGSNSFFKNQAVRVIKKLLLPMSMKRLVTLLEKESKRFPFDSSEYSYFFSEKVPPFKRDLFSKHIYKEFEGHFYRIPVGYDELLRQQYGDYMQLPPEEERINKHHAAAWWK